MAILPLQTARVSNFLRSTLSLSTIATTQRQLLEVQNQLSTGQRLFAPSDDPGAAAIAIQLQRTLERRESYADNLSAARSRLSLVDSTLGDVTDILQQVQSLASANVGSDVTGDQRASAAAVARSLYSQALSLSNRQVNGFFIFGGDRGTTAPYVESAGGVRFAGSSSVLSNAVDESTSIDISVAGDRVFGGSSNAVLGTNLGPNVTPQARLVDLRGAGGSAAGIARGAILISDGTQSRLVDLSSSDTVDDVVRTINATGLVTASVSGQGLTLTGSGAQNLTVSEVGGNSTARDLGLLLTTGGGAGVPLVGQGLSAKVTGLTPVSALRGGAGLDLAGGLKITNGTAVFDIDFSGATTVQEVVNKINASGSGALARINSAGNGIDVVNPTQGIAISVGDNGGQLAAQLGVRSLSPATSLSQLNGGRGVQTGTGADVRLTDRNGTAYDIELDGAATIQDVIDRINTAAGGAVTASFSNVGNGITLTDGSGGAGSLSVQSINFSSAAADLGILGTTTGLTISGTDTNPVRSDGVFDNLLRLASALESNNQGEITRAAAGLKDDLSRVVRVRGDNGARVKEIEARTDSLEDQNLATQSLLSEIKDTDYASAIARFQLLQTTLQANYQTTAQVSQLSLLNFLR